MTHPELFFVDYPDKLISFTEYKALMKFYIRPNRLYLEDIYPSVHQRWPFWHDAFFDVHDKKPNDWRVELYRTVLNEAMTFEAVQEMLRSAVRVDRRPARGKHLKSVKKGNAQEQYRREQLGDGFIENDQLLSAAKTVCVQLASNWADLEEIQSVAQQLEAKHCDTPLSAEQRTTLLEVIMLPRIEKLKAPTIVESKILANNHNKRLYFLWGKIKQHCEVGDTIDLAQSQVVDLVGGSATGALSMVKQLVKLGALEQVRKPKIGSLNGKSGKYRRLL